MYYFNNHYKILTIAAACFILPLFSAQTAESATVNVNLNDANQTIRGFGGMNFPRWIGALTNAQVDTAFGNGTGQLGFTIMRIDVPPDTGNWSGAVASAQRAQNNHGALVFASPWSPPASMKTNNNLVGGELKTDSYGAYATHLSDFVNYMSSNGVSLYAVSLQNEPDVSVSYESCDWTPTQILNFLANNASVIPTRVIAAESYHFDQGYTDPSLNDPSAEAQLDIVGGHIYGGGLADYPLARSKGKEVWMTEHLVNDTSWTAVLGTGKEIHDCMAANWNAYIWWYIRRSYGPMLEDGTISKRGYVMCHFTKFVRPGYVRVNATASPQAGVYVTAYKSGDTLVIVAINQNSSSSDVTFSLSGGLVSSYTKYETTSSNNLVNLGSVGSTNTLTASSINTFVGTISYEDDTTPPTPDPLTWSSEPTATGESSITMTATTATDISLPVQYYFECTTDASKSSGWQSGATYVASGLEPDTEYSFRVQARDSAPTPNVTGWSSTLSATTWPPDTTPPTPDPMTWANVPAATGPSTITMTATTATDADSPPVQYYFECTTDGSKSSAWQSSPTYIASGLNPSTSYSFRVQASDSVSNVTGWSSTLAATTMAQPSNIELLGSWVSGTTHAKESGNSRVLIVIAHGELASAMNLSAASYGGQAMTKVIDINGFGNNGYAYTAAYILNEAGVAAATTGTFSFTWSGTSPGSLGYSSAFFSNVDQTTTIGASAKAGGTQDPISTTALVTNDGDMVVLGASCGNSGSFTLGGAFTEGTDSTYGTGGFTGVTGYKSATGANETPSADFSGTVNRQSIIGFVIQAASVQAKATNPSPESAATNVSVTTDLSWTAGPGAISHDVYFGAESPGTFQVNQTETTFDPGTLNNGTTYFWRIDEVTPGGTITGDVWSFTTIVAPPVQAGNSSPADGAIDVSTTTDLSWTAGFGATSHDIYFGVVNPPPFIVNQTGTTYDTGTMSPGTTYYWQINEKNAGGTTTGAIWSFTTAPLILPGQAGNPSPADGATDVAVTTDLSWTAGSDATSHDVYFGTVNPPPFVGNQTGTTYDTGTMSYSTTYFWRINEKNNAGTTTGTVWAFTTAPLPLPGQAGNPSPANGAASVGLTADLSWTAGSGATSHDVYFGAVNPPPFVINQTGTTYDTGTLAANTTYYWQIDEKNTSGTTAGVVWSFKTVSSSPVVLLQDGFESNFNLWTDGGATDWDRATSQKYAGSYSAHAGSTDNDLISDNLNTTGKASIRIEFWFRDDDLDDNDNVYLQLYNGSTYANRFELGNSTEDTWNKCDITIYNSGGDAQYFRSNFRIKFEGTSIDYGENLWIDDVVVTAQ